MAARNTQAGGIFLSLAILIGFGWGLYVGEPMKGVLAGTVIGAAIAVLLWLLNRRN